MKSNTENVTSRFQSSVESWVKRQSDNEKKSDIQTEVIRLIAENALRFGEDTSEIAVFVPMISEAEIEAVISEIKSHCKFTVEKLCPDNDRIVAVWELKRRKSTHNMKIELMRENYMHILGLDWNLHAFSCFTLAGAIRGWLNNKM